MQEKIQQLPTRFDTSESIYRHAQEVALTGDSLGVFRKWRYAGATALAYTGIAGFIAGIGSSTAHINEIAYALTAFPTGYVISKFTAPLSRSKRHRAALPKLEQIQQDSAELNLGTLEYFQPNNNTESSGEIFFQGDEGVETNPLFYLSSLKKIAEKDAGREIPLHFTVPEEIVKPFIREDTDKYGKSMSINSWLNRIPKSDCMINDLVSQNEKVYRLTSKELTDLYEDALLAQPKDPVNAIIKFLQKIDPRHPLPELNGHSDSEAELKKFLKKRIESRLLDREQSISLGPDGQKIKTTNDRIGRLSGGNRQVYLQWLTFGENPEVDIRPLANMGAKDINKLILLMSGSKKYSRTRSIEAADIGLYLCLTSEEYKNMFKKKLITFDRHTVNPANTPESIQGRIINQKLGNGSKIRPRRKNEQILFKRSPIKSTAAASLALLLPFVAGVTLGSRTDKKAISIENRHHESGLTNQQIAYLRQHNELYNFIAGIDNFLYADSKLLSNSTASIATLLDFNSGNQTSFKAANNSAYAGNVGNVTVQSDKVQWRIKPYGKISPMGYWNEQSYYDLASNGTSWVNMHGNLWSGFEPLNQESLPASALLPEYPTAGSRLEISGNAIETNYQHTEGGVINVPVLEGAKIIAAKLVNMPNQPIYLQDNPDFVQQLFINIKNFRGPIEYWIKNNDAAIPKADATIVFENQVKNYPNMGDYVSTDQFLGIYNSEKKLLGKMANTADGPKILEEYISDNFRYSLSPLKKGEDRLDPLKFSRAVLNRHLANCNVANTLMVLRYPSLNYMTGYFDGNNKQPDILSSRERHGWAFGTYGNIYDATPKQPKLSGYFDAIATSPTQKHNLYPRIVAGAVGSLALASMGFMVYTESAEEDGLIRKKYVKHQGKKAEKLIRPLSDAELARLLGVSLFANFAPPEAHFKPLLVELTNRDHILKELSLLPNPSSRDCLSHNEKREIAKATKAQNNAKQILRAKTIR